LKAQEEAIRDALAKEKKESELAKERDRLLYFVFRYGESICVVTVIV